MADLVPSFIFKLATLSMFTKLVVGWGLVWFFRINFFRLVWAWAVNMAEMVFSFELKLATFSRFTMVGAVSGVVVFFRWVAFSGLVVGFVPGHTGDI